MIRRRFGGDDGNGDGFGRLLEHDGFMDLLTVFSALCLLFLCTIYLLHTSSV